MLSDFSRSLEMMDRLETNYLRLLCYELPDHFSGIYKSYEYSRLCTILEGEKLISINNKESFRYGSNRYLLLPPGSTIHMEVARPTRAVVFELNADLIQQVCEKVSEEYQVDSKILSRENYCVEEKSFEIRQILNKITNQLLAGRKNAKFLVDLFAQELVYYLIQSKGANHILHCDSNSPVYRAIRYMNQNCMKPVSMKQLAYDLGMSESGFCQYFKKVTKMTPNEYFIKIKLDRAKELIKMESVTETAFDLGYDNISYFILLFKREYGMTPKQYKKMVQTD